MNTTERGSEPELEIASSTNTSQKTANVDTIEYDEYGNVIIE